ncbi:MAG: sigma-70 family RNA polymerase sigma factor [Myxococcales bacterium]
MNLTRALEHGHDDPRQPVSQSSAAAACEREPASGRAFDALYTAHAGFVFRVLRGMGVPDSLADDAMQDVFLVVHRRLPEFDGRAKVTTWLFPIAVNVALNYRRRARRSHDQTPIKENLEADALSPHEEAEAAQSLSRLQAVLDDLDDEKRVTLLLADLEGCSAPEIAELTRTPLNTVYTRLRRARAAFVARWLARKGDADHG